jgi:hypothetical protein
MYSNAVEVIQNFRRVFGDSDGKNKKGNNEKTKEERRSSARRRAMSTTVVLDSTGVCTGINTAKIV